MKEKKIANTITKDKINKIANLSSFLMTQCIVLDFRDDKNFGYEIIKETIRELNNQIKE